MGGVRVGLFVPPNDIGAALDAARRAEAQGYWSVSLNDHFVPQTGPVDGPQLECLTTLTAIAMCTERVRLVPSVIAASYRTPAMLAKIGATLDHVSGGRFVLGIGSGWNSAEYAAHGYAFGDATERLDQLEETLQVVKAMWTDADPVVHGRYVHVEHASSEPRPLQQPHPPIMVGGSSRHLLGIAARHADIVNLIPPTANGKDFVKDADATVRFDRARLRRRNELLDELARAEGRDPATIERSGFTLAHVTEDPNDPVLEKFARRLGFDDLATARRSPVALLGTPEQVAEEMLSRRDEDRITYVVVAPSSPTAQALIADRVLPAIS